MQMYDRDFSRVQAKSHLSNMLAFRRPKSRPAGLQVLNIDEPGSNYNARKLLKANAVVGTHAHEFVSKTATLSKTMGW
jgi:hypothetical protein